jgi:DNA-binding response OmpR family regulator
MTARILVVDDDDAILDIVRHTLVREGFAVDTAPSGEEALTRAEAERYDLLVLDLMLPEMSGIDVCRRLRDARQTLPIVMLTAKDSEIDLVVGLEVGADDYIRKPFSRPELVSRIRALLRRREYDREERGVPIEVVGDMRIDFMRRTVEIDGNEVQLTPGEFKLLGLLARRPDEVVSRRALMEHLWDTETLGNSRACDVHIWNIRRKIETVPSTPQRLVTVRGAGFMLVSHP